MSFHSIQISWLHLLLIFHCKFSEGVPPEREYLVRPYQLLNAKHAQDFAKCDKTLAQKDKNEIASYKKQANSIFELIVNGSLKGVAYDELKEFVERFPIRPTGNPNLENATNYLMERMKKYKLDNVRSEVAMVPVMNSSKKDSAELVRPFEKKFKIIGIQNTAKTTDNGITAHVFIVKSFEELDKKRHEVDGKIVLYNHGYLGAYGGNLYRTHGASHAAQYGAVAVLVQSMTHPGLENPQTTPVKYWPNVTSIPCALISMEDANVLHRYQEHSKELMLHLRVTGNGELTNISKNVMGEVTGHMKKEFVALVGHTDCESETGGALDATGVILPMMALAAMKSLKLQPHRTVLALLFTGSEEGLWGVNSYIKKYKSNLHGYSAVLQSDGGAFAPKGIDYAGPEKAGCIIHEIVKLCHTLPHIGFSRFPYVSSDITQFTSENVPSLSLQTEDKIVNKRRHKAELDNITAIEKEELDEVVALWAVTSYVLADIQTKLPRN